MRTRRSTLRRLCLGAVLCCSAAAAFGGATLYKWVDADGVIHYSDRPEPGAQKVRVAAAQTYKGGSTTPRAPEQQKVPVATHSYKSVAITGVEEGGVLWNTGGHIEVAAELEPALADTHKLWFVIDGKSQQASPEGTASLEVTRGQHTLVATVTDANGEEMISSTPVNFVVRQTSIAQPPQGPALPKPKPKN